MIYVFIWFIIICQRISELFIAKRNEKWMKRNGAIVVKEEIYKWIVLTHVLFLISIFMEGYARRKFQLPLNESIFLLFLILQMLRIWCLHSLGRFWNTKIIVLPNVEAIKKGPYKYIKHPNYLIVGLEFVIIPLLFYAYITAILFPFLHIILMYYRIPVEEKALTQLKRLS